MARKGYAEERDFPTFKTIDEAVAGCEFDVMVDFTQPSSVAGNIRAALAAGIDCVIGTTGLSTETLEELAAGAPKGACSVFSSERL